MAQDFRSQNALSFGKSQMSIFLINYCSALEKENENRTHQPTSQSFLTTTPVKKCNHTFCSFSASFYELSKNLSASPFT